VTDVISETTVALYLLSIYGLVCVIHFSVVLQGFWKTLYM